MQFRLSQLLGLVEDVVNTTFHEKTFWVVADTLDIKNYPDRNYCFVTLVEKEDKNILAKADAVIWRQHYHSIKKFETETGVAFAKNITVLLLVSVEYSAQWGFKLLIKDIDSSYTLGKLEQERQKILLQLVEQNPDYIQYQDGQYFTYNKKLPIPIVFQKIALITAPDSDGQRDFLHELDSNTYGYKFHITQFLAQVQGQYAETAIVNQLNLIKNSENVFDVVVIVRGGGSKLDLNVFDSYELGLAVAKFPLPVIAGIGHERNISVTDMMCFESVKTPTKVAQHIISHNREFEESCINLVNSIFSFCEEKISDEKYNLEMIGSNLRASTKKYFDNKNHSLDKKELIVKHLNPSNVLARGYALLMKNNKIITDESIIETGDNIDAILKSVRINTTVNSKSIIK